MALLAIVLAGCARMGVDNDRTDEDSAHRLAACAYEASHDIDARLDCLRVSLKGLPPLASEFWISELRP
jgi:hypothetical protein